jgi:exopolysaccharide biosynthesis protein
MNINHFLLHKKNHVRFILSILLFSFFINILLFNTISASTKTIYQSSTIENITSGATLEKITRFTDKGWLNINVLRIDLSNPNVKVDTIQNRDSIGKLTNTKNLASSNGAIAAINGGFFSWSNETNSCEPIGPSVSSGKLVSFNKSFNQFENTMSTLSISNIGNILYNFWNTAITLVSPNGESKDVARYNKPYYNYTSYSIYDRQWGPNSIGTSGAPDIFEMVVDEGKVIEMRDGLPAITIPENGYVVVTKGPNSSFLKTNFVVGDTVTLSILTNPDLTSTSMAITGGAILLSNGEIPSKFTHIPEGNTSRPNPRTAVGSSKDGKTLLLVAVDGRQQGSIGMTLKELATLMEELGAYNALNLDGGGSTTMVSRELGTSTLTVINNPSDGSQRSIANGVGVYSIAPPSELDGMLIDTVDSNLFVNTSRKFSVRGYDKYFNPIKISSSKVKWSVAGIDGSFTGSTFFPKSTGRGKIFARVGDVTAEFEINSLSPPESLVLNKKAVTLALNSTTTFTVSGQDKNGYSAYIDPSDAIWTINGDIGTLSKNVFTASTAGASYICANVGSAYAYSVVSVETEKDEFSDGFEVLNGSFDVHPNEVLGSYDISTEQFHSGTASGKLTYDFPLLEKNRAAYIVFSNGGIPLANASKKVGLWVYNTHENSNWLAAWVVDTKGKQSSVYFTKGMDWIGWKHLEVSIASISSPALLTRLYTVQTNPVPDASDIYFDDLVIKSVYYPSTSDLKVPKDTMADIGPVKTLDYKEGKNSLRFSVLGQSGEPKTSSAKSYLSKFSAKSNKYYDAAAILGNAKYDSAASIKKPVISTNSGYRFFDFKNSRFIQLTTTKMGLRLTSSNEWNWFLKKVTAFKGDNIFVFLAMPPESFSDSLEGKLFKDLLAEYKNKYNKNIWVFCKGTSESVYMDRGVKYISTAGLNATGSNSKTKYLLVTVFGKLVCYQLKTL